MKVLGDTTSDIQTICCVYGNVRKEVGIHPSLSLNELTSLLLVLFGYTSRTHTLDGLQSLSGTFYNLDKIVLNELSNDEVYLVKLTKKEDNNPTTNESSSPNNNYYTMQVALFKIFTSPSFKQAIAENGSATQCTTELINALIEQTLDENEIIFAAYEAFMMDGDTTELYDTLSRIASILSVTSIDSFSACSVNTSLECNTSTNISTSTPHELLTSLVASNTISQNVVNVLMSSSSELFDNEIVSAAFQLYAETNDTADLVDTLERIARIYTTNKNNTPLDDGNNIAAIEAVLEQVVGDKALSPELGFKMKEMLRSNHLQILLDAFDVYKNHDHDAEEFVNTILMVASNINEKTTATVVETSPTELIDDIYHKKLIDTSLHVTLKQYLQASNSRERDLLLASIDVFNQEQDMEDLLDTWYRISTINQTEQETLIEILQTEEFQDHFTPLMLSSLFELAMKVDDRVLASYDVYKDDGDLREFFDTLDRILSNEKRNEKGVEECCNVVKKVLKDEFSRKEMEELEAMLMLMKQQDGDNFEVVTAALQVYEMERDLQDFANTIRRVLRYASSSSKSSKKYSALLEELLVHMIETNVLQDLSQVDFIRKLYRDNNDIVLAAFELYDQDNDKAELIDTLVRCCC